MSLQNIDGPVATATFSEPSGIAMDSQGNLIVDNLGLNTIRKITPGGRIFLYPSVADPERIGSLNGVKRAPFEAG